MVGVERKQKRQLLVRSHQVSSSSVRMLLLPLSIFVVTVLHCVQSNNAECPNPDSQNMVKYFDLGENPDLTKIIWSHATNSWPLLEKSLADDTQMIEADIIHHMIDDKMEVVMGHSSGEVADPPLKLIEFLNAIKDHQKTKEKRKGAKLDFKSSLAFHLTLDGDLLSGIDYPLWINADITQGPQGSVDKIVDLKLQEPKTIEALKCYTLSLGWTSGNWDHESERRYTEEQIQTVLNMDFDVPDKVRTYPTRAAWVADSWDDLRRLLLTSPKNTLTIWSPERDDPDIEYDKLKRIVQENKDRIYVDVPELIRGKLGLDGELDEIFMEAVATEEPKSGTSTVDVPEFSEESTTVLSSSSVEAGGTTQIDLSEESKIGSSMQTQESGGSVASIGEESTEGTTQNDLSVEGKPSSSPQTQQPGGANAVVGMPLLLLAVLTFVAMLS